MDSFITKKKKTYNNREPENVHLLNSENEQNNIHISSKNSAEEPYSSSSCYMFDENGFFKIVESENDKITAICKTCNKAISGSKSSTGNFRSHIQRVHPLLKEDLEKKRLSKKNVSAPTETNQKSILNHFHRSAGRISDNKAKDLMLDFLASAILPMSMVQNISFRELLKYYSGFANIYIPQRNAMTSDLEKWYNKNKKDLILEIDRKKFVCTTADIWSANNKSYLGMTIHYIGIENFNRVSKVLACRRIKGKHDYLNIAKAITDIYKDYKIDVSKITYCITDNATNFGKAFRIFQENNDEIEEERENILISDILSLEAPNDYDTDNNDIVLPDHFTCGAHSLNLVATTDAFKALDDSNVYKRIYRSSFAKIQGFWNLLSRSTVFADKCFDVCNCRFPVPILTRWNSTFDALRKVLTCKDKLNEKIFNETEKLSKINANEWLFIEEYVRTMEPVACGLDIIQGEKNCFFGILAPTILIISMRLSNMSHLSTCEVLKKRLIEGINKRFPYIFNLEHPKSKTLILSSASHPKFKLNWVPDKFLQVCKNLFIEECRSLYEEDISSSQISSNESEEDFFFGHFNRTQSTTEQSNCYSDNLITAEALRYLENKKKDFNVLHEFKVVKNVFEKYNTALPSSAPVERMFSTGKQILVPRRNKLTDSHFEMLLMKRDEVNSRIQKY